MRVEGSEVCGIYGADGETKHITHPWVWGYVRPRGDALPCVVAGGESSLWIESLCDDAVIEDLRVVTDYGDGGRDDVKSVWHCNGRGVRVDMKWAKWQALRGDVAVKVTVEYVQGGTARRVAVWLGVERSA